MKVLQIYNHIPDTLSHCIQSVKNYADRKKAEYIVIDQEPDSSYSFRSAWADIVRNKICSENDYLLYVDWDILLYDNFDVSGDIALFGNSINNIMWTGNQSNLWKNWVKQYEEYERLRPTTKLEHCRNWKIMRKDISTKNRFSKNTYKHLRYSQKNSNAISLNNIFC